MQTLIRKIFGINDGEGQKVALMFSYIFLIIASLLIVKPVRNSLFITHFGVSQLPYAFISVAIFAAIIIQIYSNYIKKVRLNYLILLTSIISIICLLFFWILLKVNHQAGWFYYMFYIWVALFGAITTSQFWLLANYVFNAREAKRLFGVVGAGAISGGIFGGYLTNFLAPVIGTDNMIFLCIMFMITCIFILKQIWIKSARFHYSERKEQEKRITKKFTSDNPLKLILKSKHLSYLAGIIGVSVIIANLVDYQFSAIASDIIKDEDQLTAFFGFWLSNLSIASLLVQLFLTARVLKFFGVTTSLFFLPVGIFVGAVFILFIPSLFSAILIKVSDGSFKQSINKAGLELLALPIPTNIKNQTKAFSDVFIDSLATGIGGILIILFTRQLGFPIQNISLVVILFILIWFFLINRVRIEYIGAFRLALEKRSIDLTEQNINLADASVFESLTKILEGTKERQILYVLQLIENVKNDQFIPYLKKLLHHPSDDIKIQALRIIKQYENLNLYTDVYELIKNSNFEVRVEAVCYLFKYSENGTTLVHDLLKHSNYFIRSAALICTAEEYRSNNEFRQNIDIKLVFDQFLDKCYNDEYEEKDIVFMKGILAKVIGITAEPSLYNFLSNFLVNKNTEIVKIAIISASKIFDPMFILPLINYLKTNTLSKFAREALVEYGEDVVDILTIYLENPNENRIIRQRIPRVLSMIDCQQSVNILVRNIKQSDLALRDEIIKSLNNLKKNFPVLKFDKKEINSYINDEIEHYYEILQLLDIQNKFLNSNKDSNQIIIKQKLLTRVIEEKLDFNLERIFRLLGLKYPLSDMYNTYLGIKSKQSDLRANAIEFLDNILNANLKQIIIPIVEENSYQTLIVRTKHLFHFNDFSMDESIDYLLKSNDSWLKACTIHLIAEYRFKEYKKIMKKFLNDDVLIINESARYYLNKLFRDEVENAHNS